MNKRLDIVTYGESMAIFYANETGPLDEAMSFSKALAGAESNEDYFASAGHPHVTSISSALSRKCHKFSIYAIDFMERNGKTISFDPNLRPALWPNTQTMLDTINDLAARCDWFLPGLSEGRILTGLTSPEDIASFYLKRASLWL